MKENIPITDREAISFSLHGEKKLYNLINYQNNTGPYPSINKKDDTKKHVTHVYSPVLTNLYNNLYIISCITMCLTAGITFVADFRSQLKITMGYPELLIKQLTTIGVATSACVGFTLDSILYVIPLKVSVIANSVLLSLSYLLFMCILNIENASQLTGFAFIFVTIMFLILWAVINFLSGVNFYLALRTARLYTKESRTSTIIGLVSCSFSLSISFISLIHDSIHNNISEFFGILSVINLLFVAIHILYHKPPLWFIQKELEKTKNNILNEGGNNNNNNICKDREVKTRMESCVFANTSSIFEKSVLSSRVTTIDDLTRNRSKSVVFSKIALDTESNTTLVLKEIPKTTFFQELSSFKGVICFVTVFVCIGILNNIYFIMREASNSILSMIGEHTKGSDDYIHASEQLVSKYGKVISLTSALGRLFSGMVLDFMYKKQWVYSPFPMVISFTLMLFGANLFAAISPFWAVRTTILQIAFGVAGGMYGILPVIIGVLFSVDKFNKMMGFAEFSTTVGIFVFGNMTTVIGLVFGNEYRLNIYFGICCICMIVLAVLNYVLKERINKDILCN